MANKSHAVDKRLKVISFIRERGEISRGDLSAAFSLDKKTVSDVVEELASESLIASSGFRDSVAGRRQELLTLNGNHSNFIGIDLGGTHIIGVLIDLTGEDAGPGLLRNPPRPSQGDHPRSNEDDLQKARGIGKSHGLRAFHLRLRSWIHQSRNGDIHHGNEYPWMAATSTCEKSSRRNSPVLCTWRTVPAHTPLRRNGSAKPGGAGTSFSPIWAMA